MLGYVQLLYYVALAYTNMAALATTNAKICPSTHQLTILRTEK